MPLKYLHFSVYVTELSISVRMIFFPFSRLSVCLKAVIHFFFQYFCHRTMTYFISLPIQLLRKISRTFTNPSQRRFGVSPCNRPGQAFNIILNIFILLCFFLPSAPFSAYSTVFRNLFFPVISFIPSVIVVRETPVATDTTVMPPRPIAMASSAHRRRLAFSYEREAILPNFSCNCLYSII